MLWLKKFDKEGITVENFREETMEGSFSLRDSLYWKVYLSILLGARVEERILDRLTVFLSEDNQEFEYLLEVTSRLKEKRFLRAKEIFFGLLSEAIRLRDAQ